MAREVQPRNGCSRWSSWQRKQSSVKSCSVVVRVSQSTSDKHQEGSVAKLLVSWQRVV